MFEGSAASSVGLDVGGAHGSNERWRTVDAKLRALAKKRSEMDAEEATWLVAARKAEVHRHLGLASLLEYMERVLGYGPHAAKERLRVADALTTLPGTRAALERGALRYSAVRELTRVAQPDTEAAWLAAADGKTLRELEPMVAGRRPGDLPGDPPTPGAARLAVRFEISGATQALLRDARIALAEENRERLDDDAFVAALCRAVLDGGRDADQGRARHQIALSTCPTCERSTQDGGGRAIDVTPAELELARCDAQHLGDLDAATPTRAHQDITPAVRRFVWRRDHGACVVPGCRATRFLDVHHLRWRSHGGDHTPDNLAVCCRGHHTSIHEGRIVVTGDPSSGLTFAGPDGRPYGAAPPDPQLLDDATSALRQLGFPAAIARGAVLAASSHVGPGAQVMELIRAALSRCDRKI